MNIKEFRFNVNICLKILLLLGFSTFYLLTIFTGSVTRYVHPRIIPYMIFASIVMVSIALLLLGELFKSQNTKLKSLPLIFFVIPLVMALVLPSKTFDSSAGTMGNLELSDKKGLDKNETSENESKKSIPESSLVLQDGVIVMDSSNFYNSLVEIYENLDKYDGVSIEVIGFVFKDSKEFSDNEFVAARYLMSCCAADMVPLGFLCQYDKTSELKPDTWVKVMGKIGKSQYQDSPIPIVNVMKVENTDKPKSDYVYPY